MPPAISSVLFFFPCLFIRPLPVFRCRRADPLLDVYKRQGLNLTSDIVTIDDDDYDPTYTTAEKLSPYITLEKAKEIALAQADVSAADAVFDDKEFDHDDGTAIFELEFTANGVEYEYDVDAVTGKVLKAEHKGGSQTGTPAQTSTGSTNYDDTDYGPNNDGVTDYNDTDYGPNNDGVTDYNDTCLLYTSRCV